MISSTENLPVGHNGEFSLALGLVAFLSSPLVVDLIYRGTKAPISTTAVGTIARSLTATVYTTPPLFPTANSFSWVGIDFIQDTDYKKPNPTKFSTNT